jgi:hypothetical protein
VYPVGSETLFFTDFTRAFGKHTDEEKGRIYGGEVLHARLGAQSILPLAVPLRERDMEPYLSYEIEDNFGYTKLIITNHNAATTEPTSHDLDLSLPLYKLNMPLDAPDNASLQLTVRYRNVLLETSAVPSLYLIYSSDEGPEKRHEQHFQLLLNGSLDAITSLSTTISCPTASNHKSRLKELGIHLHCTASKEIIPILEIFSICIMPVQQDPSREPLDISNIRTSERGDEENKHLRLCWSMSQAANDQPRVKGMPHSDITGSFAHFLIRVDGSDLGRAYALEHVLGQALLETLSGRDVNVEVTGVGFDGRKIAGCSTNMRLELSLA